MPDLSKVPQTQVHWVTSFSPDIYKATGRDLLDSIRQKPLPGKVIVVPENMEGHWGEGSTIAKSMTVTRDLSDDPFLHHWLNANQDIIPVDKGGKWVGPCTCRYPDNPKEIAHHMPCPGAWFCRNASRWFRKIAALKIVYDEIIQHNVPSSIVIWTDCDVVVRRSPTLANVQSWFYRGSGISPADVFYLKSRRRKVWESGLFGFRGVAGFKFFESVMARYTSGKFRTDKRWDDSHQLTAAQSKSKALFIDLARGISGHSDVVPHSPLGVYLTHRKGHHSRITKTVT